MNPAALFLHPELLPLLLLAPIAWLGLAALDRGRRKRLGRLAGPHVQELVGEQRKAVRRWRRLLFVAALAFALLGLAGPLFGEARGELEWEGVDIIVGLDVSRSMLAGDLPPTRLARAKREVRALAKRAMGDRLGLVVFAGDAHLKSPLTEDGTTFAELADLADPVDATRGGTDLGAAMDVALGALSSSTRAGTEGVIVLLTDGEDLAGTGLDASRRARAAGVRVHAVGMGTPLGSRVALREGRRDRRGRSYLRDREGKPVVTTLDLEGLGAIARATGGEVLDAATTADPLVALYEREILPMARASFESKERKRRDNGFQVPLLLAFLCGIAAVALRETLRPGHASGATALLLLVFLTGCDATSTGRDLWTQGRKEEARAAFDAAAREAGEDASPQLLYDQALAALAVGDLEAAEVGARRAAERGGAPFEGPAAFLRGNVAFRRSELAAVAARRAVDDPRALLPPLKFAEDALAAWQWAAASRTDWPEARRNVERALLWLESLRESRSGQPRQRPKDPPDGASEEGGAPEDPPGPQPPPPPPATREREDPAPEPGPELETADLPPGEVIQILDRLREKEAQKRDVRRARRRVRGSEVERDW